MPIVTASFQVSTRGDSDILDLTSQVAQQVQSSPLKNGLVNISVAGSTAALTTIEYESGVVEDLRQAISRLAPKNIPYKHDARWGDGNGHAHVRAALIGASLTIPFQGKRLLLGTWQQIVLIDFDNRPRQRQIHLQLLGE